ncbi:MAG: hypothetical protein ABI068_01190 [Ktedonobacterales bacterium]
MAVAAQPRAGGSSLRVGVLTGIIVGIVSLPVTALRAAADAGLPLTILFAIIACAAFLIAGIIATRRSGRIGSGVLAGLIAGIVSAFVAVCIGIVLILALTPHVLPMGVANGHGIFLQAAAERRRNGMIRLAVTREVLGGLLLIVAGVVFGLIGGLFGRIGRRPPVGPVAPGFTPPSMTPNGFGASPNLPAGTPYMTATPAPPSLYTEPTNYLPPSGPAYSAYPTATAYRGDDPTTVIPPQPPAAQP